VTGSADRPADFDVGDGGRGSKTGGRTDFNFAGRLNTNLAVLEQRLGVGATKLFLFPRHSHSGKLLRYRV
jgi:hypothetical protein